MLRPIKQLYGRPIEAVDGPIGRVFDVYFDDEAWGARYLVVDTGGWLGGRRVLISPMAAGPIEWSGHAIPVNLTREQVKNSPDIDTNKPVSRQHEAEYLRFFGYPYYWSGASMTGAEVYPGVPEPETATNGERAAAVRARHQVIAHADQHLRSCRDVAGHHIKAVDGEIGHVEDYLLDAERWALRYLIVSTSNWWGGRKVLIAPDWIGEVNWKAATVSVALSREAIRTAPVYDPAGDLTRHHEEGLYHHYGRPGYWTREHEAETYVPQGSAGPDTHRAGP